MRNEGVQYKDLKGKVVLVTGGGSGLGFAIASSATTPNTPTFAPPASTTGALTETAPIVRSLQPMA